MFWITVSSAPSLAPLLELDTWSGRLPWKNTSVLKRKQNTGKKILMVGVVETITMEISTLPALVGCYDLNTVWAWINFLRDFLSIAIFAKDVGCWCWIICKFNCYPPHLAICHIEVTWVRSKSRATKPATYGLLLSFYILILLLKLKSCWATETAA